MSFYTLFLLEEAALPRNAAVDIRKLRNNMKTRVTEMLGIEYPIIQGGMAWVAEHHLAAAVSEAGGLGLIGGSECSRRGGP